MQAPVLLLIAVLIVIAVSVNRKTSSGTTSAGPLTLTYIIPGGQDQATVDLTDTGTGPAGTYFTGTSVPNGDAVKVIYNAKPGDNEGYWEIWRNDNGAASGYSTSNVASPKDATFDNVFFGFDVVSWA